MAVELALHLAVGSKTATRLRGSITVALDIAKHDTEQPDAGSYFLRIHDEAFPITAGTSVVAFEFAIPASYGDDEMEGGALSVLARIECVDDTNVYSAWASIEITQCDALLNDSGTVTTEPLTMTPIAIVGDGVLGGGGGFTIEKTGDLASVTAIDIVGYYSTAKYAAVWLDGDPAPTALCAPRWIDETEYVALGAAITIPTGSPGWASNNLGGLPDMDGLPDFDPDSVDWDSNRNAMLCKVTLDGGSPVLALIENRKGT